MTRFKRIALLVCLICAALVNILFCVILWAPVEPAIVGAMRDVPVLLGLASLVGVLAVVGGVWGVVHAVRVLTHAAARLSASELGSISIEKSALVSVATGALSGVDKAAIQSVKVDVLPRRDTAVLDVEVTATPLGTDSLMALASTIQRQAKAVLEAFTEHEVRYVGVRFVESRRRGEDMGAGPASAPAEASERANVDVEPTAAASIEAVGGDGGPFACQAESSPAPDADSAASASAWEPTPTAASGSANGGEAPSPEPGPRPSLWERARTAMGIGRSKAEDAVIPTEARVACGDSATEEPPNMWWSEDSEVKTVATGEFAPVAADQGIADGEPELSAQVEASFEEAEPASPDDSSAAEPDDVIEADEGVKGDEGEPWFEAVPDDGGEPR